MNFFLSSPLKYNTLNSIIRKYELLIHIVLIAGLTVLLFYNIKLLLDLESFEYLVYLVSMLILNLNLFLMFSLRKQITLLLISLVPSIIKIIEEIVWFVLCCVLWVVNFITVISQFLFYCMRIVTPLILILIIYKTFSFFLIENFGFLWFTLFQIFIVFAFIILKGGYRAESRWVTSLGLIKTVGPSANVMLSSSGVWQKHKWDKNWWYMVVGNVTRELKYLKTLSRYSHMDDNYYYFHEDSIWIQLFGVEINNITKTVLNILSLLFTIGLPVVVLLPVLVLVLLLLLEVMSNVLFDLQMSFEFAGLYFAVPVKLDLDQKSKSKSKSKSKLESDQQPKLEIKTRKFETLNGLKIPGILSHLGAQSSELMDDFNKSLSSTPNHKAINSVVDFIEGEISKARSIMRHGFIYSEDLTNSEAFPVISNLVEWILRQDPNSIEEKFLSGEEASSEEESKAYYIKEFNDNLAASEKGRDVLTPLEKLNSSNIKIKSEVFKQAYTLLCLNYWTLNRVLFTHIKESKFVDSYSDFETSDAFVKVNHLNALLTKLLPNSIKRHLHNKSICLTNNVYAGFDAEYINISQNTNKLLSAQLSVNGCYTLKLPTLNNKYIFGSLDVSTNKFYETKPTIKIINWELISSLIQDAIDFNSGLNVNYKNYITSVTSSLISKGVKYYIKDDSYYFKFPSSNILTEFIEIKNEYSMVNLFDTIIGLENRDLVKASSFEQINQLLSAVDKNLSPIQESPSIEYLDLKTDTVYESIFDSESNSLLSEKGETTKKRRIRKGLKFNRFSVYTNNVIYLTAHYNAADLSMLSDFADYKAYVNTVNKSFVVINRPIPFKQEIVTDKGIICKNWNLKISDTQLLSPPGFTTVKRLGEIYNFNKLELSKEEISNMDLLLINDRAKFKEYAVRDSIITLLHYNAMIDYNFTMDSVTPPSTLSQISGRALDKYWNSIDYKDYQVSPLYSLANAGKVYTFKGLFEMGKIGDKLPLFIQTFRGGRNESFSYGMDSSGKVWYDYDLTSAYTTIMYGITNPLYNGGIIFINLSSLSPTFRNI